MPLHRLVWKQNQHEYAVEKFYEKGVEKYGDHHGGYLNFGLWEEGAKNYQQAAEHMVQKLAKLAGLNKRGRLLDVACGMGPELLFLQKNFGCTIEALEVTWKHLECAQQRILKEELDEHIHLHHGTATRLPFEKETFTHLLCIEGAQHFPTREDFLKEAQRVLIPGGVLGLGDFVLKRQPKTAKEKIMLETARRAWHVPKENYDTLESYKHKLSRQGFRNIVIEEVGDLTIPRYYAEQKRTVRNTAKIRGYVNAYGSLLIDYVTWKAFEEGLIEYILVKAEK
ncbi:methyltransferase domain-containing protein [Candidatus Woesearchaeota archaeon]|nr:methyltransferase domain-containing protein [Candidatus Woesearchaeota archaeon]